MKQYKFFETDIETNGTRGIIVTDDDYQVVEVDIKDVLKNIAVSPVNDGRSTVKTLSKYM